MKRLMMLALAGVLGFGQVAQGEVLEFDDLFDPLAGGSDPMPTYYDGFHFPGGAWWYWVDDNLKSGYHEGAIGEVGIYNAGAGPIRILHAGGEEFDLIGAFVTAAWNDHQVFRVEGWRDGVFVDAFDGVTNYSGPNWFDMDLQGIDEMRFISGAGSGSGYPGGRGSGNHLAIDHITYVVPEPGSICLLGLGGLVLLRRR